MAKLFIILSVVAVVAFAEATTYTPTDAYNAADSDEDGTISDVEYANYRALVNAYMKPAVRKEFDEGTISVESFKTDLQRIRDIFVSQGAPASMFTPMDDVIADINENENDVIEESEFDIWYYHFLAPLTDQLLKVQMEGEDGVISKAEFIGVLTYMASL